MRDRLAEMLANQRSHVYRDEDDGQLYVLLNDIFHPAADAEEIPASEVDVVLDVWETRGWWGIFDWVIQRRYNRAALAEGAAPGHYECKAKAFLGATVDHRQHECCRDSRHDERHLCICGHEWGPGEAYGPASRAPAVEAPTLTVERLADLLQEGAIRITLCDGKQGKWEAFAAWLLPRVSGLGEPTP